MIKKTLPIVIAILTTISGIVILYNIVIRYLVPLYLEHKFGVSTKDASAIGIIGGADGPTSIYVSNRSEHILMPVFLLLFIIGITYFVYRRLRRKKEDQ
jgi:Na+-transporting methylmalonyl-CoA/oxaloacetate decarboxylase beta subunit